MFQLFRPRGKEGRDYFEEGVFQVIFSAEKLSGVI